MSIERKTIAAAIKAAGDDGSFEAVIATFGVVDSDGDIVEHGAFNDAVVSVLPSHDASSVPLGKARIEERGELAVAVGQFNLEIEAARDWSAALKFDLATPPSVQEWSWGFNVLEADADTVEGEQVRRLVGVDTREVSPVLRGASIGTGTLSAKGDGDDPPPLVDRIKSVAGDVEELVELIREVAEGRKEKDQKLSGKVRRATVEMAEQCAKLMDQVAGMIEDEVMPDDEIAKSAARFLAHVSLRHRMTA